MYMCTCRILCVHMPTYMSELSYICSIYIVYVKNGSIEKIAHLVKHLPCKHEAWSLDSQRACKRPSGWCASVSPTLGLG